ncbi:hypothetical protein [Altererythrobacter sp. Root672]|uniref:hypothetical protein n=1 Tax=Altererythrobacter sp. Root672 TaxID=1736584 RepID=UPI0006F47B83|nr:hypothetical protein [Altererythrobacter sp. Root672]KRA83500.1 hypothetical protein ASD76_05510 [Altererythrobacter sp. Root672]
MKQFALRLVVALAALGLPGAAEAAADDALSTNADGYHTEVVPYIEAAQVVSAQIDPVNDVVTWTNLAVGIDASIVGKRSAASVSLRYERRIGWDDDDVGGDTVSGIARAGVALAEGLTMEAGGYAARTRVEADGSTSLGGFVSDDSTSQIYSAYAGPSVHTMVDQVEVEGHYRFGYTKVEEPDEVVIAPGQQPADIFDESTIHTAQARAGIGPDVVAPFGFGAGGGFTQQDISNFDQRIRDAYARADAILPVSPAVALVGGVGLEDVEVSSRDVVRDGAGNPVVGPDGRLVTDKSSPRRIDYQTDGLIWDAGVMWRPSRRTALEAYVGHRYGMMNYHGTFSYAPNARESYNVAVYDNLTSFGGALVNQLAGLPANFDAFVNPINGQVGGCVASLDNGNCLASALGSLRSSVFKSRGIVASHSLNLGRTQVSTGVGYDQRKYIPAAGSGIDASGVTDDMIWVAVYGSTELDMRSSLSAGASINWFDGAFASDGKSTGYSMSMAYNRDLLRGLSGVAAVGLDGVVRDNVPDFLAASALLGLRYSFFDR